MLSLAMATVRTAGDHLREWRQRRRLSQLELAIDADISSRHLSFVETGRSQPSREMILRLAEQLEVPLRERNAMLLAAGYAPAYRERPLDDPDLLTARIAVDTILTAHEPYPAFAVDIHWNLVAANRAVPPLMAGAEPFLFKPPVNVLRLSLHPSGIAPRIVNLVEWRAHILTRLRRQVETTSNPSLADLLEELSSYSSTGLSQSHKDYPIAVPLQLQTDQGILSFISTTTVFGTPMDITLSELAIEAFFPADAQTGEALARMIA
jgi:transcriptional regulator with XRE-family HTH domain